MQGAGGGGIFLGSVYATMQLKTAGFGADVAAAKREVSGLGNALKDSDGVVKATMGTYTDAAGRLRYMDGTFASAGRSADKFASTLNGSIRTGLAAAGIGTVAAGGAILKMAGDFEQSLSVLRYNSGATAQEFEKLSARARELGKDASLPGVTAADAAKGMNELAKAGLSVNDILAASKGVLSLAKAGNVEVGLAAETTARALNAFNLEGKEAGRIADLLAAAANKSTADVQDLAFGLQMAGAGSKQMNVPLQDTVAALALFSNAGINGSDAGTSLKQMFLQLANPVEKTKGLMKDLGLKFFDAKGEFIGLSATAQMLQDKLGKLSSQQRLEALDQIFGSDSSRVAGILLNEGAAGVDKMREAVTKQGAAAQAAKAYNDGFKGALDSLVSTLQTIGTDLGMKVLPPLTAFIRALMKPEETIGNFVNWLDDASPVVQGLTVFVLALAAGFAVYAAGVGIATVATLALALLTSPLFLVVAAVAALAAIAFVLINNWSEIPGFFKRVPGYIVAALSGLPILMYKLGKDIILGLLDGAGSKLPEIGKFFLNKLPSWMQNAFKAALGIHSPSTVFAGYGVNVVEGLAQGITGSRSLVTSAMSSLDASMTLSPTRTSMSLPSQSGLFGSDQAVCGQGASGGNVIVEKLEVNNNVDEQRILRYMSRQVALA